MLTLSGDLPPEDPAHPAPIIPETIKIKALSTWNALLIGVVSGFATSVGAALFMYLLDRRRR